jgi:hypothetical protein
MPHLSEFIERDGACIRRASWAKHLRVTVELRSLVFTAMHGSDVSPLGTVSLLAGEQHHARTFSASDWMADDWHEAEPIQFIEQPVINPITGERAPAIPFDFAILVGETVCGVQELPTDITGRVVTLLIPGST